MLIDQETDGWVYLFEGSPIARPQRYACLHGGPSYQVIMHSTLQFFTDICSISDRTLDPAELVKLERQIGDAQYKAHNAAAVVSAHSLIGVGAKIGEYDPMPKKTGLGRLEYALPS